MLISAENDFENIDNVLVGLLIKDCNELLAFFGRVFHESIDTSNSAQAANMFEYLTTTTQLKNQVLAWQDKTIPHGTSIIAKEGVLRLQALLEELLVAVRVTTNKQFSRLFLRNLEFDSNGKIIQTRFGEPKPIVMSRITVYFYYFQGIDKTQADSIGDREEVAFGSTKQDMVRKEMERHKEEEYQKASEAFRGMGDASQKALADLDVLIQEESG